jgi:hypothetical protein
MRRGLLFLLGWSIACGADEVACPQGFEPGEGNLCLQQPVDEPDEPTPEASLDALLDALPPCTMPTTGDGNLDLDGLCVRGACVGGTYASFEAVLGPGDCSITSYESDDFAFEFATCVFAHDIIGSFDGIDGAIDRESTTSSVFVFARNPDTTDGGFGIGAEWSCAIAAMGPPDESSWARSGAAWLPVSMSFGTVSASDEVDNDLGLWVPDGRIDRLMLSLF